MKHVERVFALLIVDTFMVGAFHLKITNEAGTLPNILKTDKRIFRYKRRGVELNDCEDKIKERGLTLINFGMETLAPTITVENRFYEAVKELYNFLEKNQETIKNTVLQNLETEFPNIKSQLESESDFEKSFIFTYTTDYGFEEVNKALRDHRCEHKILTYSDKALAPYAAVLMAILMYWDELPSTTETTYRESIITQTDLDSYQISASIVWLNFASSSTDSGGEFVGNVTFNIDNKNSDHSRWKPKRICKCSNYPDECEALYPPGSAFDVDLVTMKGNHYIIYLILRENNPTEDDGRKRRSVSTDPASKRGFCHINSSLSCQINMWNVLVLGILGKCVSNVFL